MLTLDGEVVVLGPDGTTNFADLQASFQEGANNPLTYFCFDLLHIEGRNPRDLPPAASARHCSPKSFQPSGDIVRFSEHLETGGEAMFHKACELHAEGIVSKRADAPYTAGRSGDWLKSKCLREQEFVIAGYTLSSDGDDRIGSLLLGYYGDNKLIYAGRTGTGFTQKLAPLTEAATAQTRNRKASLRPPSRTEARRGAIWVKPQLVAQVRFATWTADNLVRQAAFLGLREDKPAPKSSAKKPPSRPSKAQHTRKAHRRSKLRRSSSQQRP